MKLSLTALINATSHAVLYIATALLVVVAIFISVIRWYPNLSDIVEEKIETRLADILQADISIQSLDVSRNKLFSEIIAQNVEITDRENNTWQLRKAKLAINLSKSLLSRSLRIKEVSLEGLDLSLQRDQVGDLHINQTFLLPSSAMKTKEGEAGANKYADVRLALIDSNIHWLDELTQTNYQFNDIDISIDPTLSGYKVFISGDLPQELGKSLRANLEFTGELSNLQQARIKFYAKTEQFHLKEVAKRFVGVSGEKVPVSIDSEVWGEYSNNTLTSLRGSIQAENIVEDSKQINQDLCLSDEYVQQLSMNFDWQNVDRNWRFFANDLEVITSKRDWPKSGMQFKLKRHSLNAKSIFAHIGNINLGAICNTLHTYSPHIVQFEDRLKEFRFNASIDDLFMRFDLSDNHQSSYQYSLQFSDASLWMAQGNRLVKGVSGYVEGGDVGGKVQLDSSAMSITVPEQFPGFDLTFATQGELTWSHNEGSHEVKTDSLRIYNNDMNIHGRVYVNATHEDIYTDSQLHIDSANASVIGNYFPLFQKTRTTKKWLTEAIHKGDVTNATVVLRGNMFAFPFHKSSGVFQTLVNVENGILEYKRGWPKLNQVQAKVAINKDYINITSNRANTLNSKVKNVDINIESFLRSILQLKGTVDGPAQDLLYYLGEANLVKKTNSVVDQISLQGYSRLEVKFARSLTKKIHYPARVAGNIHFLGNSLNIHKVGIELDDLAGEVAFDAAGASSESVMANVYGRPITLSLSPKGEGASNLNFKGGFDLNRYLAPKYPQFKPFFNGVAQVDGDLHLPSFFKKNNPDKLRLLVKSDLQGVKSNLPAPLFKDSQSNMNATLSYDQSNNLMQWHVEDLIGLHFSLKPQQPFALRLVDLNAVEQVQVPEQGLTISGAWQEVAPDLWLAAYSKYNNLVNNDSGAVSKPKINVQFDSLLLPKWPAKQVSIVGEQKEGYYSIRLDADLAKGVVQVPDDKSKAIAFNMNSVILNKNNVDDKKINTKSTENKKIDTGNAKTTHAIDPRQLRPFTFTSKKLLFNDIKLSNVTINTSINDKGLLFEEIKLAAQDMKASAFGAWTELEGKHQTELNFQIDSIDLEDTLVDLGFNSSLKKGEAKINGNIAWHAAPYQFDLGDSQGRTTFDITEGSVSEINPGNAGRLLALLNLGAISRRLSLDFKDVTNKGFTFNSIKGDLDLIQGGDLKTDKIDIKASAADIEIKGKTNLVEQTYDQTVFVTPAVSGTLPAAGAIVGGPVGAAAGIIADRVVTAVGLNKVTKIEYKMTGTWQDPVIEKVAKKSTNTTADPKSQ